MQAHACGFIVGKWPPLDRNLAPRNGYSCTSKPHTKTIERPCATNPWQTTLDLAIFLAVFRRADVGAPRGIRYFGVLWDLCCAVSQRQVRAASAQEQPKIWMPNEVARYTTRRRSTGGQRVRSIALKWRGAREDRIRKMAEAVGFEPTVRSHARRFSRPLPSTTRPHFLDPRFGSQSGLVKRGAAFPGDASGFWCAQAARPRSGAV